MAATAGLTGMAAWPGKAVAAHQPGAMPGWCAGPLPLAGQDGILSCSGRVRLGTAGTKYDSVVFYPGFFVPRCNTDIVLRPSQLVTGTIMLIKKWPDCVLQPGLFYGADAQSMA